MLLAFLLGAASASSLPLGAWLAGTARLGRVARGTIAGFGAGTLIGAVGLELIDRAGGLAGPLPVVGALLAGAALFTVADSAAGRLLSRGAPARHTRLALSLLIGGLMDGLPESMALGADLLAAGAVSPALLWAIFLSNLPEAVVAAAALRAAGWRRGKVIALWLAVALAAAAFTAAGYRLAATVAPSAGGALLALAAGGIIAMVSDTLIPAAARMGRRRAGLAAALGVTVSYLLRGPT